MDQVNKTGEVLKTGLLCFQKQYPSVIDSVRGRGTFLAFNACSQKVRDNIIAKLKKKGTYTILYFFNAHVLSC